MYKWNYRGHLYTGSGDRMIKIVNQNQPGPQGNHVSNGVVFEGKQNIGQQHLHINMDFKARRY